MIIEKLVVKTGTQCSLCCEKCGEFNPYLTQKGMSFSLDDETLSRDVYKIAHCVERIKCVHVAGGEPFLHSDLFLFISYLSTINNIDRIEIVTNGTILPDDIFLQLLCVLKDKVNVLVSDYSASGIDNRHVIKSLREFGVPFKLLQDMVWKDKTNASYNPLDAKELRYIAENCTTYRKVSYFSLINGIITAHCPTAGSLLFYHNLHKTFPDTFFDLHEIPDNIVLSKLERLQSADAIPMCQYCLPSYIAKDCPAGLQLCEVHNNNL